jgi:hypothetical protein
MGEMFDTVVDEMAEAFQKSIDSLYQNIKDHNKVRVLNFPSSKMGDYLEKIIVPAGYIICDCDDSDNIGYQGYCSEDCNLIVQVKDGSYGYFFSDGEYRWKERKTLDYKKGWPFTRGS